MNGEYLRARQDIKCNQCMRRTTCFADLTKEEKAMFLCKECRKKWELKK